MRPRGGRTHDPTDKDGHGRTHRRPKRTKSGQSGRPFGVVRWSWPHVRGRFGLGDPASSPMTSWDPAASPVASWYRSYCPRSTSVAKLTKTTWRCNKFIEWTVRERRYAPEIDPDLATQRHVGRECSACHNGATLCSIAPMRRALQKRVSWWNSFKDSSFCEFITPSGHFFSILPTSVTWYMARFMLPSFLPLIFDHDDCADGSRYPHYVHEQSLGLEKHE